MIALLLALGALAYANSFAGVMLFDDRLLINPDLESGVSSLASCFSNPRSIVQCSFQLDRARAGLSLSAFHGTNLLIHLCAALLLYAVVRRGLLLGWPAQAERSEPYAAATALLWVVHPLHTESVTYLIQRAEALMSLCFLLVLYAALRRFEGARGWSVLAVLASVAGMSTKPVMVAAPFVVYLFDRCFVSRGLVAPLRRHPLLYLGLVGSLGWLFQLLGRGEALVAQGGDAGFVGAGITWSRYFLSQGGVLLHYLRLVVVPYPLCLDYKWPAAYGLAAVVPTTAYVAAIVASAVAVLRGSGLGFLGAGVLLLLAPSSSFLPIADLAAEHRTYLALAFVLLALVLLVGSVLRDPRVKLALVVLSALALASLTSLRNRDYHSALAMYARVVAVRPQNERGQYNLANELAAAGQPAAAIEHYRRALELKPAYYQARNNLGLTLLEHGRAAEAREVFLVGVARAPQNAVLRIGLAHALMSAGDLPGARAQLERAIELSPGNALAHSNLGSLLNAAGEPARAEQAWHRAIALDPKLVEPHLELGLFHRDRGEPERARARFEAAIAINPDDPRPRRYLATLPPTAR